MVKRTEIKTIGIHSPADSLRVQQSAKNLAEDAGFDTVGAGEIAIAASELAVNLAANQTLNGRIIFAVLEEGNKRGLEVQSQDDGPGIADIRLALLDGYSKSGSLGVGLGAVSRLMDEFEIHSNTMAQRGAVGTQIVSRKWLHKSGLQVLKTQTQMQFASINRPLRGEQVSGDAVYLRQYQNNCLVALIDGLGHGTNAHTAAMSALEALDKNSQKELNALFSAVHQACRGTRGVAMSVCRIDGDTKTLRYAGVGNVSTRVFFTGAKPFHPTNTNGTVGRTLHRVKVYDYRWEKGLLIMHSDGLSAHWGENDLAGLETADSSSIAKHVFERFALERDDATILVGRQNHTCPK